MFFVNSSDMRLSFALSSWRPLTTAFSFSDFHCERLATSCIRGRIKTSKSTKYNGRGVIMPYHGILVHLFGDLLEVSHVANCQEWIIH
jgi:hypothetical protein